ncbi:MAG: purine-nucleoside phosphorylase [Bacteroidales bacterium]|jgi:purine-nucleoside phosphorylase
MLQKINESAAYIDKQSTLKPAIAIILGSGLSAFANEIEITKEVPFQNIPHFPQTSVDGHRGTLLFGLYRNIPLLILQGRVHYYEGYTMQEITWPVRVFKHLGISTLLLSNAAGGMNPDFETGDLMVITDHINMMPNPLIGKHEPAFGARFPDMTETYDRTLTELAFSSAKKLGLTIRKGCYVAVTGPTYETPAEYKYFRIIGGDAVGMSTIPEVIAAHQMGIKCFALSVITDLGVPGKIEFLTHEMVKQAAEAAEPRLAMLLKEMIGYIGG